MSVFKCQHALVIVHELTLCVVTSAPELRLFKNACVLSNEGIMGSNTAATVICQLFHSKTGTWNPQVFGVIVKSESSLFLAKASVGCLY